MTTKRKHHETSIYHLMSYYNWTDFVLTVILVDDISQLAYRYHISLSLYPDLTQEQLKRARKEQIEYFKRQLMKQHEDPQTIKEITLKDGTTIHVIEDE